MHPRVHHQNAAREADEELARLIKSPPRTMRNFFIRTGVDRSIGGQARRRYQADGPAGKCGGFATQVFMRRGSEIYNPVRIFGFADEEGNLVLNVVFRERGKVVEDANGNVHIVIETQRKSNEGKNK